MTGRRITLAAKALRELGPRQLWDYSHYRLLLHLGIIRRQTESFPPVQKPEQLRFNPNPLFPLPDRQRILDLIGEKGALEMRDQADEISTGKVRLFGGQPVSLQLETSLPLLHWTEYELGKIDTGSSDYRQVWEPGRFGWGISLARAYHLTGDERYADVFWENTGQFLQANPTCLGVHWVSAQEVALRLIALAFCYQVFRFSGHTNPGRSEILAVAIADHARRIPPSLTYARSQNNNHLINEAAGLYTAGLCLPSHPQAGTWRLLGWRWLNHAFQGQIAEDGAYIQHSANYHRLILHTALWITRLSGNSSQPLPAETHRRLAAATRWLLSLLDSSSGKVPNLGPNDGAYLLPLSGCPFEDYRPVLQAAGSAFLGYAPLEDGPWDEMKYWLGENPSEASPSAPPKTGMPKPLAQPPHRLDNQINSSWAYLRVASFRSRPGHADQLHLDLWWRGVNLAQDAGSYLYNDPPPWNNSLARTGVHNTITVDGLDQMTLASRFLWLDWAQAIVVEHAVGSGSDWERLTARHDGYRRLGLTHQRTVIRLADCRWLVEDTLQPAKARTQPGITRRARLHWLLPAWPWRLDQGVEQAQLTLTTPFGPLDLVIGCGSEEMPAGRVTSSLVQAGELLSGSGPVDPTRGWASNTYAQQLPALSFAIEQIGGPPMRFTSDWRLPESGTSTPLEPVERPEANIHAGL